MQENKKKYFKISFPLLYKAGNIRAANYIHTRVYYKTGKKASLQQHRHRAKLSCRISPLLSCHTRVSDWRYLLRLLLRTNPPHDSVACAPTNHNGWNQVLLLDTRFLPRNWTRAYRTGHCGYGTKMALGKADYRDQRKKRESEEEKHQGLVPAVRICWPEIEV